MMQATPTPSAVRAARRVLAAAIAAAALLVNAPVRSAHAQNAPATPAGFSVLQGSIIDSIHGGPLANAKVVIEGTNRTGVTTAEGRYRIDSIPPGPHRVAFLHPVLDTIGDSPWTTVTNFKGQLRTQAYPFAAGQAHDLDLYVPGGAWLANQLCSPAQRQRGPAVMIGFVKDPDTNKPALGAKVSLVFNTTDVIGRKMPPTVREPLVDSTGFYHICGLPGDMTGKVQVFRNGVSSGEVPIAVTDGFLALRAFSIVEKHQSVAEVKNDSGKVTRIAKGAARVTGKVVDKSGRPLGGARVALQGGGTVTISRANGDFTLDSLPSGTQSIQARKLGYAAAEQAVELSSTEIAKATITMEDFVPTLATMRVEAAQDKALSDLGYLQRKQMGMGTFLDGNQVNHESMNFSDVMRTVAGLRVSPAGDGRTYVITDSRNAQGGCVTYYVDGAPWQTMSPGDIDQFVRPNEVVAVEVYHGSQAPPQFTAPGQSSCAVIVVWTLARARPKTSKP
ncbi:MAG TPA: carboxypeptidase regulatory-like domain-containing protein [Gemmatimonadaceae bacterium]|nr:carboxypeptidase regulatory-like domain-containing protein [Gemmatimonadaceae bacterium]